MCIVEIWVERPKIVILVIYNEAISFLPGEDETFVDVNMVGLSLLDKAVVVRQLESSVKGEVIVVGGVLDLMPVVESIGRKVTLIGVSQIIVENGVDNIVDELSVDNIDEVAVERPENVILVTNNRVT